MAEVSREDQIDIILGRTAVERGLITPVQLRDALAEQANGVSRGRMRPRRLGAILASKRFLTDPQVLSLERELEGQILEQETWHEQDMLFGQILIHRELARSEHIDECMREQAQAIQRGDSPVPLVGELLVERGYVSEENVAQVLAIQERTILVCSSCGRRCMVLTRNEKAPDQCAECNGRLDNLFESDRSSTEIRAADQEPSRPETVALGKYKVLRGIGRGRMGAVYEALDTQLNRKVALKFILSEIEGDDPATSRLVERFGIEAEMAARLPKHPHIVSVYEAGAINGRHFIAMELVQGKAMSVWQRENAPSVRRQLRLLRDVAAAVEFAHEHGVLHRDLKPQNVMVDPDDQPFVTDFGLAQAFAETDGGRATTRKGIAGTPRYMSPEQAAGEGRVDRRSDVFSLGVMLYEILTGHPPFQGATSQETRKRILNDPAPPMSGRIRGLPRHADLPALEAICMNALRKKPEARTPTAGHLSRELAKWLRSIEPGTAAPRRKRIPTLWILGAVAGVMALAIPLFVLVTSSASLESRLRQAENLRAEGRNEEALRAYEKLLKEHPDSGRAVRGWFEARLTEGREARSRALMELERALLVLQGADGRELPQAREQVRKAMERLRVLEESFTP